MIQTKVAFSLTKHDIIALKGPQLGFIIPDKHTGVKFRLHLDRSSKTLRIHLAEEGIIAFNANKLSMIAGSATVWFADIKALIKLQAFIDYEGNKPDPGRMKIRQTYGFCACALPSTPCQAHLNNWIYYQHFEQNDARIKILTVLRNTEWYWVVKHLLDNATTEKSLGEISADYGVSISHFRRMSKEALSQAAKVELCRWRLSRSVIDIVENHSSITDIAYNRGYSSLSHLSNDAKVNLGFSPIELKKIISIE